MSSEEKACRDWYELEKEVLSSKELTLHVLVELFGGHDGLWAEIQEFILLGDMNDAYESGTLEETHQLVREIMDKYLNKIVEKELLGAIPKK